MNYFKHELGIQDSKHACPNDPKTKEKSKLGFFTVKPFGQKTYDKHTNEYPTTLMLSENTGSSNYNSVVMEPFQYSSM